MVDNFNSGIFLIVETSGEKVAVYPDVYALSLEIFEVVELQIWFGRLVT